MIEDGGALSVPDRRATARLVQLIAGLVLFGASLALLVRSELGLDPWDVFHQGLSVATGLSIGVCTIVAGVVVLLLWIPLRQRPGSGPSPTSCWSALARRRPAPDPSDRRPHAAMDLPRRGDRPERDRDRRPSGGPRRAPETG